MSILSAIQFFVGFFLILFTLFDAFVTILSLRGGGPATSLISQKIWRLMLMYHQLKPSHRLLSASGPVLMILTVIFWYGMLYAGWFLLFHSVDANVLNNNSLSPASGLETLYFTGVTLSGLGYGDFTAQSFPWTIYSTLAVSTATLLTSLGLSYIIAVVPVALEKHQLAHQINAIIKGQSTLIEDLNEQKSVDFVWDKLFSIQLDGTKFSAKYGAYPIVAYFHASKKDSSFSLAYLQASDILFYIANHPNKEFRPPAPAIKTIKNLITYHTENLQNIVDVGNQNEKAQQDRYEIHPSIKASETDLFTWKEYQTLRETLVMACVHDGW